MSKMKKWKEYMKPIRMLFAGLPLCGAMLLASPAVTQQTVKIGLILTYSG